MSEYMSEKFKQVMFTFTIVNKDKLAYNSNKSIYIFLFDNNLV